MKNDFLNAVEYSHLLLKENIAAGEIVVDATAGNGHDSKYLAELVGDNGQVYAFDIQQKAVTQTKDLLAANKILNRVKIILDSHANLNQYISEKVAAVIFNLGYLPGGNKEIITKSKSTISALKQSLELIKENGIIILVIYSGHPGGKKEKAAILDFVATLNYKKYNVLNYKFLNQPGSPPEVLAIKKR